MPRGAVPALLPIVSLVAAVAGAGTTVPTRDLLYLRPLGGNAPSYGRLFLAGPDGTGARDTTPPAVLDVHGAGSPDGRRIAVSAIAAGDHDPEIFTIAADGSGLRSLTDNHHSDRQPSWSPNGRRIAFSSARTGLFQIYSMPASGGRARRLSNQADDCESSAWSPNGRWIVFSCELGYWKLVRMRADGSRERRLLPGYPLSEMSPTWTPDGLIMFGRGAPTASGRGIFSVRPGGTGLRRVSSHGGEPAVSPEGRLVAFVWMPDGANQELFLMNRDGSGLRQITFTNGISEWNRDWPARGR
jgi:Tol biopolymer transport system component